MQDRLFRAAERLGGLAQADPAGRRGRDDAPPDLVGDLDSPGCLRHDLAALEEALPGPAANRVRADVELGRSGGHVQPAGTLVIEAAGDFWARDTETQAEGGYSLSR